ncbi:glycerophosphodiester phosphodiesterase [Erythrobacter arachoides]|uniref:Glycerophosphodiester phosphodiesterase n=1 Tax=Aurantiacibacter arachoides TaxID=1850444 RepID=A0A845AAC2_9SPHN|nr:glycerophosphodiester phosphodiesterase family protein [Aurantiacibacter arachoides]MXO94509.1 glycerophosphodiester phosphodiesterase [Aurantiacibacter arachoides]GGD62884.1 phosphodiesterase [Aurantiacibacter arachoides]
MADTPDWLTQVVYAHRGLHGEGVPENSLAAFALAAERGLGIECDIRVSRDGRAIVFHDAVLDRLTGSAGVLAGLTVGELTAFRLGDTDQSIPTLRDLLTQVSGRVPLLIELKTDRRDSVHMLCRAVRRDLEGYTGPVAVMSFDPRVPAWFASRLADLPRGLVVTEENGRTLSGALRRWLALRAARATFLAYDIRDLPSRFASRSGLPLLTWTVKSRAHADVARAAAAAPIMEGPVLEELAEDGWGVAPREARS